MRVVRARLRQWTETIRELREDAVRYWSYYKTAVEARVMLTSLINMLSNPPFKINAEVVSRVNTVDAALYALWHSDASLFVWDDDWKVAYPAADYEFLYGKPRNLKI